MMQNPPPAPPQASASAATSRRPVRRFLLGAAASLAAAAAGAFSPAAAPVAYAADASPRVDGPLPHTSVLVPAVGPKDRLVVTVRGVGRGVDGRFELHCHPEGGSHPHVRDACGQLDQRTIWGKDPFAPVQPGSMCTMLYGGPATAHVTGTWAGRQVDARFDRGNGCEIARWDALVPVLPDLRQ